MNIWAFIRKQAELVVETRLAVLVLWLISVFGAGCVCGLVIGLMISILLQGSGTKY